MNTSLKCIGVDLFLRFESYTEKHIDALKCIAGFELKALSNRGTRIWPGDRPSFHLTDIFRARYMFEEQEATAAQARIVELLSALNQNGIEWVHLEKLHKNSKQKLFSEMQ